MREIEVKAKVRDIEKLKSKSAILGIKYSNPIKQIDVTYESKLSKDDPEWNIFRIRKESNKFILTMKYKASTRSRDNHEREAIIDNPQEMADMLNRVGYTEGVTIQKSRQTANYKNIEICIDEVVGLGTFIEVEKLTDDDVDVNVVQAELWSTLLELGIEPTDRTHKGYDTLMHDFINHNKK